MRRQKDSNMKTALDSGPSSLATGRVPLLAPAASSGLTPREGDVLRLLAQGLTYEEIGSSLEVSLNTIRTHVRSIYGKLDVTTKTEAAVEAIRRGLL